MIKIDNARTVAYQNRQTALELVSRINDLEVEAKTLLDECSRHFDKMERDGGLECVAGRPVSLFEYKVTLEDMSSFLVVEAILAIHKATHKATHK